jgi:integron integrase
MEPLPKFRPNQDLKLMDQVRQVLRYHHYSFHTEQTYCNWILRFIRHYHAKRHPKELGAREVEAFLSHLASVENVAAATQRQALNAIIFLYKHVLDMCIGDNIAPIRAKRRRRLPVVMTVPEVRKVLNLMQGQHMLMAELMYGAGLRRSECLRLRVNSVDADQKLLYVRFGKGGRDRVLPLPRALDAKLQAQIDVVERYHAEDLAAGFGDAWFPEAFARKIGSAAKDLGWQYLFPSKKRSTDPRSGIERRHHVLASGIQKAVRAAVKRARLTKRITCHTFRHSFATHLLENGVNIRVVQELMGHTDVKTTEIYTHVMQKDISVVQSPLDTLRKSASGTHRSP